MSRQTRQWVVSFAVAGGCWGLIWAAGEAARLRPHPVGLALVVVSVAVLARHLYDLALTGPAPRWTARRVEVIGTRRGDPRFTRLQRLLVDAVSSGSSAAELRSALAALTEDRLRDRHGISRREDPSRAAALIGPELDRLLREPTSRSPITPAELATLIDRIESL